VAVVRRRGSGEAGQSDGRWRMKVVGSESYSEIIEQCGLEGVQADRLQRFVQMVASAPINLVGWQGPAIWTRGVQPSLALKGWFDRPGQALDIGSGGGFPGMVLAIATPHVEWTLLEVRAKRAGFLKAMSEALSLGNVRVAAVRAEQWIRDEDRERERFDWVTERAVAPVVVALELGLPYVRVGGSLFLFVGGGGWQEVLARAAWISVLGGGEVTAIGRQAGGDLVARIPKIAQSPMQYPRAANQLRRQAKKHPGSEV
jgi:16S rRNA (guanine527-N7)-methyltransferase